ncbi:kelch repeat-containing protein [Cystobacter fuscus]|uniref:kelch repeat-containing protein n=1 Tax=Cystobacter fuscus TaxID=43 RepID=UPI0037BE653B
MRNERRRWLQGLLVFSLCALTAACGEGSTPERELEPGTRPTHDDESSLESRLESSPSDSFTPVATEVGLITLSIDGLGTASATGTLQVQKPAGATVRRAFLAAASTGLTRRKLINGDVRLDGQTVNWSLSVQNNISSWNHWAEVTSIVRAKLDKAPAGRVPISVSEVNSSGIEGEILAVIFDDPAAPARTVHLLFGTQQAQGNTLDITLAEPFQGNTPGLLLDLSLGISFGFQSGTETESQRSIVEVNGLRMTSLAGGQDDGENMNGSLLTVGGLDDTHDNPPPFLLGPGPRQDDELYDLRPFVDEGSTRLTLFTQNPSNNDNIFFGALYTSSAAAAFGEAILLGPVEATDSAGSSHRVTARVQDRSGQPLAHQTVNFLVTKGTNKGVSGQATTDASGHASFIYTNTGGPGVDQLQATFVKANGQKGVSNVALMRWTASPPVAACRDLFLDADATCGASGSIDQGSFDPDGDLAGCIQSPAGPYGPGTTPVTLTCTDLRGNTSTCTGLVRVVDRIVPTLTCPVEQHAECVDGGATVAVPANASDNCGVPQLSGPGPTRYALGKTSVTQTASDDSGNRVSCTSTVTIQDTLAPTILLHGQNPLTISCGKATYVESGASAHDACFGDLADPLLPSGSVNTRVPGSYSLAYSAVDPLGHVGTAYRVVQVLDNPAGCYQPTWTPTGPLHGERGLHATVRLLDGRVLTAGGWSRVSELYDPSTGTWSNSGVLSTTRRDFTLTVLTDGTVLAAGGAKGKADPSAERYQPATGTWAPTGFMNVAREEHTATRLADGRVLVTGGNSNAGGASCELYDPSTATWVSTGSMSTARRLHTATLLSDGRVLVAGGLGPANKALASAEIYDPISGSWHIVTHMAAARDLHTATLLASGQVLIAGGADAPLTNSAELYDPASNTWTSTGAMNQPRRYHTATRLASGRVLVTGGYDDRTGIHAATELHDPASGTWKVMPAMHQPRYRHTATLLSTDQVLVAGGLSNGDQSTSEVFASDDL